MVLYNFKKIAVVPTAKVSYAHLRFVVSYTCECVIFIVIFLYRDVLSQNRVMTFASLLVGLHRYNLIEDATEDADRCSQAV